MADTPSAALPEIRVEEIRANDEQIAAIRNVLREEASAHDDLALNSIGPRSAADHQMRRDSLFAADALLATRDRLQRRVEELEAASERVRRHLLDALVLLRDKANYETRQWAPQAMDLHDRAWSEVQGLIPTLAEVRALWNAEEPAALTSETPHAK